ncbi:uncharacterized protein LOC111320724 [Stylophora pistillata]|uniref:uncharacterized protein LOC111320724 n=1 Tax=Stylophora pistillata TaxID=50429 RepID=UPI000C03D077|nr:uncharacterized protein LOC111320724 [Stylophora pistillata]
MVLWLAGYTFTLLWLIRLAFTLLFVVPAFACLSNDTSTEVCGNRVFTQRIKDDINMAGTFVEAGNSILIISLIFLWGKFNVMNFFLAVPRLAVFWYYMGLFCVQIVSIINIDILPGERSWIAIGVSLLLEFATLFLLCLTLKFVKKSVVSAWTYRNTSQRWAKFLYCLYVSTLWMYLLRNLALVTYDMALFAMNINSHAKSKQIDHITRIVNIAIRSSFVQFFYAAIFRNVKLSKVCEEGDSVPQTGRSFENSLDTVLEWEPSIK